MLPRERQYFPTGDAIFEDRIPILVLIPHSQQEWLYLTFFGLLAYAADLPTWITGGETTPEEAVDVFTTMWEEARPMLFLIGMISDFAAPLPDDSGWLQCDGTPYLETDFPDLFAAIGSTYNTGGEPTGTFRVPDATGRVRATINGSSPRLPAWAITAGGVGGESEHMLAVSEMPSHTHTDTGHFHTIPANPTGVALTPGELPIALPEIPLIGTTSTGNANLTNTGGDASHNNVQPTIALYTYILAKF